MFEFIYKPQNEKTFVRVKILFSLMAAVLFMAAVYFTAGIWFETNDDVFISELLSGKLTGSSEFHCPYVSSLLTYPISMLYRIAPGIGWWGILIFAILFFVVFINIFSVILRTKNICQTILALVAVGAALLSGIHNFSQAQFTSSSMLLAVTGYVALISMENKKCGKVIFVLCELVACFVRDSSMMIVQPLGFLALAGFLLVENKDSFVCGIKKLVKPLLFCGVCVLGIVALTKGVNKLTFNDEAWHTYSDFDEMSAYLVDYETRVPYEALSDIFEKYDITKEDYEQILEYKYWYPANKFSKECIDELLPRLETVRGETEKNPFYISAVLQLLFTSSEFWHLHQLTILLLVLVLFTVLSNRNHKLLWGFFGTFLGYLFGIVLLAYRNRFVLRVMMPYYQGMVFLLTLLLAMAICECFSKKKGVVKIANTAFVLAFVIGALLVGKEQFSYLRRQNDLVNGNLFGSMREINDYCNSNSDNHYVLDMSYARNISTDVFEGAYFEKANYIYSGSWYSAAPSMVKYGREYLTGDNICYCVLETQEFKGMDGMEYYASQMGTSYKVVDTYKLSSGATLWVYLLER